jgi:hypothetical protein
MFMAPYPLTVPRTLHYRSRLTAAAKTQLLKLSSWRMSVRPT